MANIDKVSVKNRVYNIVSPAVVSDYIEVIGGACTKPDGYVENEVILAKQNDVQLLFKATQTIAFGANIVENTNCVRTTLEEVLKNAGGGGGASTADQVSYDNSDSGLEAENVQEAVDELATKAGTASSQIQTLTNKVTNEIATRAKVSGHNFVSMKLSPYKAQANNYVSIGTQTDSQLAFTTENHNYAEVQLAYALPIGNYKASIGEITASDSYTPIINIYFLDASGQNVKPTVSLTSNQTKDFEIDASVAYILISFLGTQGTATAAIRTVTFNNLMIRLATDESADYEPYAMTNQEITALLLYKTGSIIASEAVTVNSSHVLRFGQVISVHVDFTVGNAAIPAWDTAFLKIPSNILPEGITGTMQNASTVIQSVYDFTNDNAKLGYVTLAMGSTGADKGFFSNRSFAANTRYNIGMVFIVPPTM